MKNFSHRTSILSPSKTVAVDTHAKMLMAQGCDVINLSAGEPSESAPDFICEAAVSAIERGYSKYSAPSGMPELKKLICEKFSSENKLEYQPEQIVVSAGAKQSIFNGIFSLIDPGDEVLIPEPYWVTYPEIVKLAGGTPVFIKTSAESGFKINGFDLKSVITPASKLLIVNSPSNPSGAVYRKDELKELAEIIVENDLFCISDEIYEHITYDLNLHISIASLGTEIYQRTIVANGFSKSFAMPGWRLGYSACLPGLADQMGALQSQCTLHPSNISQYAAMAALSSDNRFPNEMVKNLASKRKIVTEALEKIPELKFIQPAGAFYFFFDISAFKGRQYNSMVINSSSDLCKYLLSSCQLAVVPGIAFGMDNFIRISFTSPETRLSEGMTRLKNGLAQLKA